jgi:hypothetical protein
VYCWFWDPTKEIETGVSEIVTGLSVTSALTDLVGSATLVAFTVTVSAEVTIPGAV